MACTLALAPVFSKALNIAWILTFLLTVSLAIKARCYRAWPLPAEGVAGVAKTLVLFFAAGLLAKLLPQVMWSEVGQRLSFEINALAAAFVAWLICRLRLQYVPWFPVLLGLGLWAGLALTTVVIASSHGEQVFPTNAVNWAAGTAAMLCLALGLTMAPRATAAARVCVWAIVALMGLAVLLSGKRGAYFAPMWALAFGVAFWLPAVWRRRSRVRALAGLVVVLLAGMLLATTFPQWVQRPIDRLSAGATESLRFLGLERDSTELPAGSVDSRLHLYQMGMESIGQSPGLGFGLTGRDRLVAQAEAQLGHPFYHLHNEFIDAWVAYGVLGLVSSLCFPIGLMAAGWRARKISRGLAVMLTGFGLSHFICGLSNVNSFHNYYQTLFAVCVVLPFFWWPLLARQAHPIR